MSEITMKIAEACIATASAELPGGTLPSLGSSENRMTVLVTVCVLLAAGIATLILARTFPRRRSKGGGIIAASALVFCALAALGSLQTPPASAVPGVEYGAGCTLISVDHLVASEGTVALLPGDRHDLLAARLTNRYSQPVMIELSASLDQGAGTALLPELQITVDGVASRQIVLAPGASAQALLAVELPIEAENSAQGTASVASLTFTATEQ